MPEQTLVTHLISKGLPEDQAKHVANSLLSFNPTVLTDVVALINDFSTLGTSIEGQKLVVDLLKLKTDLGL